MTERHDAPATPEAALKLFAVGFYPPRDVTGAERSGWNAARQLAKRGHRITIFTEGFGQRRAPTTANIETVYVETERPLDVDPEDYALARPSVNSSSRESFVSAIEGQLATRRPDAMLVNWGVPFTSFVLGLAGRTGIPVVTVLHGSDVHTLNRSEFKDVRHAVLASYRKADARIAVAESLRRILGEMGVGGVTTIRNAIDPGEFRPVARSEAARERARLGIPADVTVYVHVSNLRPVKDPMKIVEAARIALRTRSDLHFLIVGDGPLAPELRRAVGERRLRRKFTFTGWVPRVDVRRYMGAAHAHVMSSVREGTPLVVLEAFATGRPTVSSRVGGVPELVQHGENGFLYEPGDVETFAAHMLELTDPETRSRLSRGALLASRRHSIEELGRSYEDTIRLAIRRKRAARSRSPRGFVSRAPARLLEPVEHPYTAMRERGSAGS